MSKVFGYPAFSPEGEKVLTRMTGDFADMMMNITVYCLQPGQSRTFRLAEEEMALLLIQGQVTYQWAGRAEAARRENFFTDGGYCLHVCRDTEVTLTAQADSEVLLQSTNNQGVFEPVFYTPGNYRDETFGQGQFEGKAQRTVRTFFDYANAPYSNMVCGEIVSPQGGWNSYPPHSHPQPEVYYYRFDKPQGFGACFIGEEAFKIADGSFCAVPGGLDHPQVTAPGYPMYYVWMIRHFPGDPWKDRNFNPAHQWLLQHP